MPRTPTDTVSPATLATLLGVSRERVDQLARAGVLVKAGRGRYVVADAVAAYVAHRLRDADRKVVPLALAEARRRKEAALAELRELEVGRMRGELVDVQAVAAVVFEAVREQRDQWQAAPARWASDGAARLGCEARAVRAFLDDVVRALLTATPPLDVVRRLKARGVRLEDDGVGDGGPDTATA